MEITSKAPPYILRPGQGCFQVGHSYKHNFACVWRHEGGNRARHKGRCPEGGGTLQEVLRSGLATGGSRCWLQQRSVQILNYLATLTSPAWSAVTLSSLAKKDKGLDPWTGNVSHHYHNYHCQFWSKSIEVPNESYNVCCTSNSWHYSMRCPPLPPGGDEVLRLFGAVRLRAVRTVKIMLFVPSERARASTQGGEERIKIYYVRSCSAQSCSGSLIWAVRALWEN